MNHTALLATLSACLVLGGAAACTTKNSSTATNDGGLADAGVDGAIVDDVSPLTCVKVLQCATNCSDSACEDACVARATPDAKTALTNLVACYQANACDGGDCVQTKCAAELSACAAQEDTGGKPVDTVPPGTAPPAALVGKWHSYYAPNAQTEDWTFNADGTAAHYSASAFTQASGCQWGGITDSTGTVVISGEKLTYYQTGGTAEESACGKTSTKPAPMKAYEYAFAIGDDGKLLIVDQNLQSCIASPGYQSCRTTLDRQ